jgi:hypothetical protein
MHSRTTTAILFFAAFVGTIAAQQAEFVPGRLVVQIHQNADQDAVGVTLARHGAAIHREIPQIRTKVIRVPESIIDRVKQSLERSGLFLSVERDHIARPAAIPNDPNFPSQWHLSKIQAPAAWDMSKGSSSMVVAVLDSGVDSTHPDLSSKVVAGWNFVNNNSDTHDILGHGTAVAGTLAAATNNGNGGAGVAWSNPIMPLVVLNSSNYADYSTVASAITYAADHGARIINISLGGSTASSALQSAVDYAWNKGSVVFAAASNNSNSTQYYPAACNNVVAVSATDQTDSLASFSNYGSWITVSAPGDIILTTTNGGGYASWYGTSLATPVAAGVGALVLGRNPSLSASAVVNILKQNSDDLGAPGFDPYYGWGRVNAYRAVAAAGGNSNPPPPAPAPAPSPSPAPPPTTSSLPIRVNCGGNGYTDSHGNTWSSDFGYTAGNAYSTSSWISGTPDPALYQTEHYSNGTFAYQFNVPNGAYTVNLKFAEIYFTSAGQRVFNVALNGSTVLSNYDIVAQTGGQNIANDRQFTVNVTNGQISIQFLQVVQDPKINAIEILAGQSSSPAPAPSSSSVRVNCGGNGYTDSLGHVWSADYGYSGGNTYSTSSWVSRTSDPTLYQTERYGNGSLNYQFSVPSGTYTVNLKFAEIYFNSAGQRIFNVAINGSTVLSNFDIVAQAGGGNTAVDRQFVTNVTNGQISIQFFGVIQNPKISAIEIVPGQQQQSSSSAIRVHAGGGAYTDSSNQVWSADYGYSGGNAWGTSNGISSTNSPALYQTERWAPSFQYQFPVSNGTHTVTLKFAEIYFTLPNQRVFNVSINGQQVLSNFDIIAQTGGPFIALDRPFTVNVTNGMINIQFQQVVNNPKISAIQIQ